MALYHHQSRPCSHMVFYEKQIMTTSSNKTIRAGFCMATAVATMLIVWWKYDSCHSDKKNNPRQDDNDDNTNDKDASTISPQAEVAFPWEPQQTAEPGTRQEPRHNVSNQDQQKELDFLASMTFANGGAGMRAPSCYCCN